MNKLPAIFILSLFLAQNVFAGHHPLESDDNSGRSFLIVTGIVALVLIVLYFIQKKNKK